MAGADTANVQLQYYHMTKAKRDTNRLPPDENTGKDENEKDFSIKKNPNPRANENIPQKDREQPNNDEGVGSEITDGEGG